MWKVDAEGTTKIAEVTISPSIEFLNIAAKGRQQCVCHRHEQAQLDVQPRRRTPALDVGQ